MTHLRLTVKTPERNRILALEKREIIGIHEYIQHHSSIVEREQAKFHQQPHVKYAYPGGHVLTARQIRALDNPAIS